MRNANKTYIKTREELIAKECYITKNFEKLFNKQLKKIEKNINKAVKEGKYNLYCEIYGIKMNPELFCDIFKKYFTEMGYEVIAYPSFNTNGLFSKGHIKFKLNWDKRNKKNEEIKDYLEVNCQDLINEYIAAGLDVGNISDGYHTFNELYHHRAILFAMICNQHKDIAWKSLKHFDENDKMYDGMFIVGIGTPFGQVTYHYDINPYWDLFKVKELDNAPKWDGSTPEDCINRLEQWIKEE